jgi:hypothetical protein
MTYAGEQPEIATAIRRQAAISSRLPGVKLRNMARIERLTQRNREMQRRKNNFIEG